MQIHGPLADTTVEESSVRPSHSLAQIYSHKPDKSKLNYNLAYDL